MSRCFRRLLEETSSVSTYKVASALRYSRENPLDINNLVWQNRHYIAAARHLEDFDMADDPQSRDKRAALRRRGCLHHHPEQVRDELFTSHEFFDPEDLVQVKYEMLRRVRMEGATVRRAAASFGLSRPSFYAAQERFDEEGLVGLVPEKPGPKEGHKLTEEVVDFLERLADEEPALRAQDLAERLRERFAVEVHSRSIERALERRRKKNSGRGR